MFFKVISINQRHTILSQSIGTRPEENHSYEQAQLLLPATISFFLLGTVLEIVFYVVFNFKVSTEKVNDKLIKKITIPSFTPGKR